MIFGIAEILSAQNIGMGTSNPVSALHSASNESHIMTLENTNSLNSGVITGLNFGAGINSASTYKYTGAIRTIGGGPAEARMGFFTFASSSPAGLLERMTILDNGNVGINNTNPLYDLSVNGSSYFSTNVGIQTTPISSYALAVNGSSYFSTYVGIQAAPSSSYSLAVNGPARYYDDVRVDGILNPNNTLTIGNNTTIEGTLTVQNGKGIVRSVSSTQMKIKRTAVGFGAINLGAGATLESGYMNFGEDFSNVTVFMGQAYNGTGDYAKVLIMPFEVDETNDRCRFKLTNVASSAITFDADWEVVMIGN